jgi:hypothetical protein
MGKKKRKRIKIDKKWWVVKIHLPPTFDVQVLGSIPEPKKCQAEDLYKHMEHEGWIDNIENYHAEFPNGDTLDDQVFLVAKEQQGSPNWMLLWGKFADAHDYKI